MAEPDMSGSVKTKPVYGPENLTDEWKRAIQAYAQGKEPDKAIQGKLGYSQLKAAEAEAKRAKAEMEAAQARIAEQKIQGERTNLGLSKPVGTAESKQVYGPGYNYPGANEGGAAPVPEATGQSVPPPAPSGPYSSGDYRGLGMERDVSYADRPKLADKVPGAVQFLEKGGGLGQAIGDLMDVYGTARSARGGVDRDTRLQKEYAMKLESQRAANAAYANLDAELKKIDPQMAAAIKLATEQGQINTQQAVQIFLQTLSGQMDLAKLKNWIELQNMQTNAGNVLDRKSAGFSSLAGNAPAAPVK